jgi:dTDP-4-amino-4,6-dideoxygalactose transaminase
MTQPRVFLSPPCMSGQELEYVKEAFASNYIAPLGPMVDRLEHDICQFTGTRHCAALSSGTAALHLALLILGVKPGDEVICSSFTFAASANPIAYVGATPVFVDSESDTWNMCPLSLEAAIQDRMAIGKKPKTILLVHLYGMPAKLDEIMAIATRYDIPIIEDAAEAIGAEYRSQTSGPNEAKALGSFGVMGIYSFNGNKIITTSGGGALVSDQADHIERACFLATQARDPAPHYEHSEIGYNYRMSNIVAAIGRGQMEALPGFVERCRAINARYRSQLEDLPGINFLTEPNDAFRSNFWLTTMTVDSALFGADRETIRLKLEAENIESRPVWKPMHLQPVFQKMDAPMYGGEVCERIFRDGLCLPSGPSMSDDDVDRVSRLIVDTMKQA